MADLRIDVKHPPFVRLHPIAPPRGLSTQSYSSLASDEIELVSNREIPADQRKPLTSSEWAPTPHLLFSKASWTKRHFWIDTWNDMRNIPVVWLARCFVSHVLPLLVISSLIYLLVNMATVTDLSVDNLAIGGLFFEAMNTGSVCTADGSFQLTSKYYTPWNRKDLFAINLNFGNFAFGIAKLIDICWDVVVGRGGQGLLAIYSYVAFTKALSRTMESSTVSNGTFSAITLQQNTLTSLLILSRDFLKTSGRRAKFAIAWIIFAASFVLFSPTWLSAMSGYTADIKPFVVDKQESLVPLNMFEQVLYTIHDASRFNNGFQDDHQITVGWSDVAMPSFPNPFNCSSVSGNATASPSTGRINFTWSEIPENEDFGPVIGVENNLPCKWLWAVSKYAYDYGFLATSPQKNTTFQRPDETNITTPMIFDPPLNISVYTMDSQFDSGEPNYDGWWYLPYGPSWRNPETNELPYNVSNPTFYYNGSQTLYNLTVMNKNGTCQQGGTLVQYKWGFSFVLLFAFSVTFLIWSIGTWALYLDAWLHSSLELSQRDMGPQRAVLDMARSMETKLDTGQVELQSNSQLKTLTQNTTITYSGLPLKQPTITRWTMFKWWWQDFRVKPWVKHEKWWLGALFVFILLWILCTTTPVWNGWTPYYAWCPPVGVLAVIAVGKDIRSRWLLFAFFFLTFWIFNIFWIRNCWGDWCYSPGYSPY